MKGFDRGVLTVEEKKDCNEMCQNFVNNRDPSYSMLPDDHEKVKECFKILRNMYWEKGPSASGGSSEVSSEEVKQLRNKLRMKENEINVLMGLVKKKGLNSDGAMVEQVIADIQHNNQGDENKMPDLNESAIGLVQEKQQAQHPKRQVQNAKWDRLNLPDEVLADREKAFAVFKDSYNNSQAFEDNKTQLKDKIKSAKSLGQEVAMHRTRINDHKSSIEKIRRELAVQGLINMDDEVNESPEEAQLRIKIEDEKKS